MSNRSPKILWPIDYSSMALITYWCNWLLVDDLSITALKTLLFLSCTIFSFESLLSLLDAFFLVSEAFLLTMWRRKVLITNTDDSQLCSISLYPTLYSITKQLNSNQPVWNKTNKYADKNPGTTWFSIFCCGCLSAMPK